MRLVWVELRRLCARRFFTVGILVLLSTIASSLAITAASSTPPDAETLSAAPFVFPQSVSGHTLFVTVVLALFGFVVGASMIGAEWSHGTLTGLLLWEPRRIRVFVAKLIAVLLGIAAVGVLAYAANYGGAWLVARYRGVLRDAPSALWWTTELQSAGRGLALALTAAALGYALALTLKHTAAALGVAVGYLAVFEIGVRLIHPPATRGLVSTYVAAWVQNEREFHYQTCEALYCTPISFTVELWGAAAYLAVLAALALVGAAAVFRRREVA